MLLLPGLVSCACAHFFSSTLSPLWLARAVRTIAEISPNHRDGCLILLHLFQKEFSPPCELEDSPSCVTVFLRRLWNGGGSLSPGVLCFASQPHCVAGSGPSSESCAGGCDGV